MYNVLGVKIFSNKIISNQMKIDASTFKNGVYIINAENANRRVSRKIVIF